MSVDHNRGLCGKSDIDLNKNRHKILNETIIPKCKCCGSKMRIKIFFGGLGLFMAISHSFFFVCDKCNQYHQTHSQIIKQETSGAL